MVAKLVLGLVFLTALLAGIGISAFWYFRERARMKHERQMKKEEQRHEEHMAAWDDGELDE